MFCNMCVFNYERNVTMSRSNFFFFMLTLALEKTLCFSYNGTAAGYGRADVGCLSILTIILCVCV